MAYEPLFAAPFPAPDDYSPRAGPNPVILPTIVVRALIGLKFDEWALSQVRSCFRRLVHPAAWCPMKKFSGWAVQFGGQ
jgi:hypothetical protein